MNVLDCVRCVHTCKQGVSEYARRSCLAYVLVSLMYIHVHTEYHCRIVLTICTLNKAGSCTKTCFHGYAFHLLLWQVIKTMFELLRVFLVEAVYSIHKRKTHQLAKRDITSPKQLILMQEKINGFWKVSLSVYSTGCFEQTLLALSTCTGITQQADYAFCKNTSNQNHTLYVPTMYIKLHLYHRD